MKRIFVVFLALALIPLFFNVVQSSTAAGWVRTYAGNGGEADGFFGVAVDSAGNIYVTGYCTLTKTNWDAVTIKYSRTGARRWVRRYNGPDSNVDVGTAIAVDNSGNAYITGVSLNSDGSSDIIAIKYSAHGKVVWTNRYNRLGNGENAGEKIAVDRNGSTYVTGTSQGTHTGYLGYDYVTIKYDANGVREWVRHYDGPGNGTEGVRGLVVDSNSVIITGGSTGTNGLLDYATIKYDSQGTQKWVRRYNGPGDGFDMGRAVVVDGAGNVYVTGPSDGGSGPRLDIVTIKYGSKGGQKWLRKYNGTGNGSDWAFALALDSSGNVIVSGNSLGTKSTDYITIKYDAEGTLLWANAYDSSRQGWDEALAIAVDAAGSVYVTGTCTNSQHTTGDLVTIKYSAAGEVIWLKKYNGPGQGPNEGFAIAVDDRGNAYVAGWGTNAGKGLDALLIKY